MKELIANENLRKNEGEKNAKMISQSSAENYFKELQIILNN